MVRATRQTMAPLLTNNPLEERMTRAQVARRRFKSSLPRKPAHLMMSPMQALARTADLFDRLRNEMQAAGVNPEHAQAALVYFQPHVKEILAQTVVLPKPEKIPEFAASVMSLDKPVFLGVLFLQHDAEAEKAGDMKQANVLFGVPFTTACDAPARMLAARDSQRLKGGLKKLVN
jgi:hypothetical protein